MKPRRRRASLTSIPTGPDDLRLITPDLPWRWRRIGSQVGPDVRRKQMIRASGLGGTLLGVAAGLSLANAAGAAGDVERLHAGVSGLRGLPFVRAGASPDRAESGGCVGPQGGNGRGLRPLFAGTEALGNRLGFEEPGRLAQEPVGIGAGRWSSAASRTLATAAVCWPISRQHRKPGWRRPIAVHRTSSSSTLRRRSPVRYCGDVHQQGLDIATGFDLASKA